MRRGLAIVLIALSTAGCRSFRVEAFGLPLGAGGSGSMSSELTTEEKAGVILLLGVVVAGIAVGVAAAD